jgi:outer membrane protein assembly factor BamB
MWPLMIAICFVAIIFGLNLVDFSEFEGGPIIRMLSDTAFVNVFSLGAAVIAAGFAGYWFFVTSRLPRAIRIGGAGLGLVVIVGLAACLRIEAVRGDLRPEFRWRWSKAPDRELMPIEVAASRVDLKQTSPKDYPQFLGPGRSLYVLNRSLASDWSSNPPKQKWKTKIGAGWSAFSAANGYAVTQEQRGDEELVTCYEIETGKVVWTNSLAARHETTMGYIGPRATPTIFRGDVYTLGATGVLQRIEGATGKTIWKKNLLEEAGSDLARETESIAWGRSGSPLVAQDLVIVAMGGPKNGPKASLAAYDLETGEQKWRGGERQASYASPKYAEVCGVPMILSVNEDSVSGHDVATGKQLWEHDWPGSSTGDANCSQPIVINSDIVMVSKGYGQGAMALQLRRSDKESGAFKVEKLWDNNRALRTKFTNVAVDEDFAYGLSDGLLQCVNGRTGDIEWKARKRFGNGQVLGVDGLLLVQSEDGEITLVSLNAERYQVLGSFQGLDSNSGACWNNMCLYGNLLLLRNAQQAACWELPLSRANTVAAGR